MNFRRRRRSYYYERHYTSVVRARTQAAATGELARYPRHVVIVERNDGTPKMAVFQCPDGCGEILRINVSHESGTAGWRIRQDVNSRVSLYPSIWRTTGCNAHFFFTLNVARGFENRMPPPHRRKI